MDNPISYDTVKKNKTLDKFLPKEEKEEEEEDWFLITPKGLNIT